MPDPRHQLGRRGEQAAARWLAVRGWRVLERRWRTAGGELDLVCIDPDGALVGLEVKLRSTGRAGTGLESIDSRRLRRLRAALSTFRALHRPPCTGMRIDLVTLSREGEAWRLCHYRGLDRL